MEDSNNNVVNFDKSKIDSDMKILFDIYSDLSKLGSDFNINLNYLDKNGADLNISVSR